MPSDADLRCHQGWVFFTLELWTPDEVTPLEAILTLAAFPLLVYAAYRIDKHETAAARRKLHQVDASLPAAGWVGGGGAPLRVLDEHGGLLSNRSKTHDCR